ncbi:PspC domain-containing protein [Indioceanicola profundi]|uniref:PspC domain-containing protein n=1 Tax=Indioceanicola profundi TaxID=2220096 RepID=UPI0013C4C55B|nr:PspC domain-containing protein [Indioceanicola profundi]
MNAFDRMRHTARTRKLCKDKVNGWIFGICAGVAWWLGVKTWFIRLLAVIALIMWPEAVILAYVVGALVLNRRPRDSYDRTEDRFGRKKDEDRYGRDWRREWDRFERGY